VSSTVRKLAGRLLQHGKTWPGTTPVNDYHALVQHPRVNLFNIPSTNGPTYSQDSVLEAFRHNPTPVALPHCHVGQRCDQRNGTTVPLVLNCSTIALPLLQ